MVLASAALAMATLATPASADEPPDLSQPHQHALLLHVNLEPFSYGTSVDLAGVRTLRTNTHMRRCTRAGLAQRRSGRDTWWSPTPAPSWRQPSAR